MSEVDGRARPVPAVAPCPPQPLLHVADLRVTYGDGHPALAGASLHAAPGEILAVVGPSGSGKSTLARACVGLLPAGAEVDGSIRFRDEELADVSPRHWRSVRGRGIAAVFQDALSGLHPVRRIGTQVADVVDAHWPRLSRRERRDRVVRSLLRAGLVDAEALLRRYPHELSGGMRQRAALAVALASEPALLIADEPTTALDGATQSLVLDTLAGVAASGAAILLITHDLVAVADAAHTVAVIDQGRVVEFGDTAEVLERPSHDLTRHLLAARQPARPRCEPVPTGQPVVSLERVSKTFRSGRRTARPAVADLDLTVHVGTCVALVGPSGAGKTTAARLALALEQPTSGTVRWNGDDVAALDARDRQRRRRRLAIVHQDTYASLDPRFTAHASISEPLEIAGWSLSSIRSRVDDLLADVGLTAAHGDRPRAELSGGERQRVCLARALAADAQLIVLDEPLAALDTVTQASAIDLLESIQAATGVALLLISHDPHTVRRLAHRVVTLHEGRTSTPTELESDRPFQKGADVDQVSH